MTKPKRATPQKPDGSTVRNIQGALQQLSGVVQEPSVIEEWANNISLLAFLARKDITSKSASYKISCDELEELAKAAYNLAKALSSLHAESTVAVVAAIGDEKRLVDFQYEISRIAKSTYAARTALKKASDWPAPPAIKQTDETARQITDATASAFIAVTGKIPQRSVRNTDNTAYGPFLELLKVVFFETGHLASAEYFARDWIAKRRPEKRG